MNIREAIDTANTAYNAIERLFNDKGVNKTIHMTGDYPEITLEALEEALSALRTIYQLLTKIQALDAKDSE